VRHVYNPARRARWCGGGGRQGAVLAVFVVSALLHEVAVAVPLHAPVWPPWRAYAFWGVMLQVPLVTATERLGSAAGSAGNFIFWLSFCGLGQPTALIGYFVQWARERGLEPLPRRV
jgi:diacylglycerol O-acyltransferase-1